MPYYSSAPHLATILGPNTQMGRKGGVKYVSIGPYTARPYVSAIAKRDMALEVAYWDAEYENVSIVILVHLALILICRWHVHRLYSPFYVTAG